MDVFDLQASVKIDTTDANQKLDALIAKAKELNGLLDSPHNININNGNGGNGGTPYVNNPSSAPSNPTGLNGYVPLLPVPVTQPTTPTVNGLNAGQATFNLGAGNQALRLGSGNGSFGSNLPSVSAPQDTTITANNGARIDLGADFFAGMITTGTTMVPTAMAIDYATSHIYNLSEEAESSLRAQGDAYKEARRNGYKGSVTDWANGDYDLWSALPHYSQQSKTSELETVNYGGGKSSVQRKRNIVEDNVIPVVPEVDANAAADIAAQVGEVTIPARVAVTEVIGTGAAGAGGESSSVAGAVNKLSNKLEHMTIQVGKKTFGRTVVDNSGRSLQNFLGASQQSVAGGYGWR